MSMRKVSQNELGILMIIRVEKYRDPEDRQAH
jgi:hypothetical protein